jgi:hypothetical protein
MDKEEVIKDLLYIIEEIREGNKILEKYYIVEPYVEENLVEYRKFLKNLQDLEWISVKQEKPKTRTIVWIYGSYDGYDKVYSDHMSLGIYYGDDNWQDILDPFGTCSHDTVVEFWMPIKFPEGPKR